MTTDKTLQLCVLASGSSGNATFVRAGATRLLIDVGISCRRLSAALATLGESLEGLDAILLTHEHSDHVKGLDRLRHLCPSLPVYTTPRAAFCLRRKYGGLDLRAELSAHRPLRLGEAEITPLPISHDALDPLCFRVEHRGLVLAYATDLGVTTPGVEQALSGAHLIVLEANYCPAMLRRGPYPESLKRRVASSKGHLSNTQSRDLLAAVVGEHLEHVVLAHLSEKNNTPQRAREVVGAALAELDVTLHIADPKEPGPLISASGEPRDRVRARGTQQALPF